MKHIILSIFATMLFVTTNSVFADDVEPMVNYNVTVKKNVTPEQCPADWNGDAGSDQEIAYNGGGTETDTTSPGVMSCTGCAVDQNKNCVCKTCYTNYDS